MIALESIALKFLHRHHSFSFLDERVNRDVLVQKPLISINTRNFENVFICTTYAPFSYSLRADATRSCINKKQMLVHASVTFHDSIIYRTVWLMKCHTWLCGHRIQDSRSILLSCRKSTDANQTRANLSSEFRNKASIKLKKHSTAAS